MESNRKLASIMFTDIVGYSTLMQIDERRARDIRLRHRQVFKEAHEKFGGKIVQYFGDGTLSIFDSNVKAVECAVEMQIEFRKEPEVPLRIGIHSGDITIQNEEAFGTGLNIAARIEPICEPGGVFISEKVYDDIKNHSWLRAISLGAFRLKNIFEPVGIYAVSSKGISVPEEGRLPIQPMDTTPPEKRYVPPQSRYEEAYDEPEPMLEEYGSKNKTTAGFLAFFLGVFGVHRFYLGRRWLGILYFVAFFATLAITIDEGVPAVMLVPIIAFIDAILLWTMPKRDFDSKYNGMPKRSKKRGFPKRRRKQSQRKQTLSRPAPVRGTSHRPELPPEQFMRKSSSRNQRSNLLVKSGFDKYKHGNYTGAKKDFEESLETDYNNPNVHFMLACVNSIMKDSEPAFFHLSSAIDSGFQEFEEIYENEGLEYLRSLAEFQTFVDNDYQIVAKLPEPQDGLLESKPYYDSSVLDKISDLGELMERGVISREEFDVQKERLLDQN